MKEICGLKSLNELTDLPGSETGVVVTAAAGNSTLERDALVVHV